MNDLLTNDEQLQAAKHGWGMGWVYDTASGRWLALVLGIDHPKTSASDTYNTVYQLALHRDPTAIRALQLMAASFREPSEPISRKKKK